MRFFLSQTALDGSRLVIRRFFPTSEQLASRFLNSRQDQSVRCDFALTKTCNETGLRASPICLLFLRGQMQNGDSTEKQCFLFSNVYNNCLCL